MRIFHIVDRDTWRAALAVGEYRPPSLDAEGFVHFSFADQVGEVANRLYRVRRDLFVIEIDTDGIDAEIRVEDSYGTGTAFPHLYGSLPMSAVVAVHDLGRDAAGNWVFSTGGGSAPASPDR